MNPFYLEMTAYEVLGEIHVQIKSRELPSTVGDPLGPISLVETTVQGPEDASGRAWLQDALIAALEAL